MSKLAKMKSFITSLFGIKEYKLNEEGHLDVSAEDYTKLTENYGAEFVAKFEKMLKEETTPAETKAETTGSSEQKTDNNQTKTDMNLTLLCALLAVNSISLTEGNATLSEEQLKNIEAQLKKLQDEKTAAETNLSAAVSAMDELGDTVKAAADPKAKVEAIRAKLAEKPGAAATRIQEKSDGNRKAIDNADAVSDYAREVV